MLKEKTRKALKVVLTGLMMALCMSVIVPASPVEAEMLEETEPNGNPATANVLPLNTWISGACEDSYSEDWYQFTVTERSITQFSIQPSDDNTDTHSWKFRLIDQSRHTLMTYEDNFYTTQPLGLKPGKYYLVISNYYNRGTYHFKISNTKTDQWEYEQYYGNKDLTNANISSLNKQYTGRLYCGDDVDYYRFKLKGNNKLNVKFTIDDTVASPGTWWIEFIEYNSRKSLGYCYLSTNETVTVPQCSGDLIVRISNSSNAYGDIYHIQVSNASTVSKPAATRITSIKAGKRQAVISWKKASKATGYYVYRSTSPNGTYKKIATVTGKTSYTDKKSLQSKHTYYYKVVSFRKSGSKIATAKASAYKKVKIL